MDSHAPYRPNGRSFRRIEPVFWLAEPPRRPARAKASVAPPERGEVWEGTPIPGSADPLCQAKQQVLAAHVSTYLGKLNRWLGPGCRLAAWPLLPERLWDGPYGHFMMMACDFYPASPENLLFLSADAQTAERLGLPLLPEDAPEGYDERAVQLVQSFHAEYWAEHQRLGLALAYGNLDTICNADLRKQRFSAQLHAVAESLAIELLGPEGVAQQRFQLSDLIQNGPPARIQQQPALEHFRPGKPD